MQKHGRRNSRFRYKEHLLDIYSKPENIVTSIHNEYIIPEMLSRIANELGVSMVLVDLRAGFSEYSAPFLFDPRVKKYLVTSTSSQSVAGLTLILEQMDKGMNGLTEKPLTEVFLTMVPDTLGKEEKQKIVEMIDNCFETEDTVENIMPAIFVRELPFSGDWVHLRGLGHIFSALEPTQFYQEVKKIVEDSYVFDEPEINLAAGRAEIIKKIHSFAENQITAESNAEMNTLMTQAIGNLKRKYSGEIPCTVIMGAKGSGKTFLYRQMVKSKTWQEFCTPCNDDLKTPICFVPVLAAKNFREFTGVLDESVRFINDVLRGSDVKSKVWFSNEEKLTEFLQEQHTLLEWKAFWELLLVKSVNPALGGFCELNDILEVRYQNIGAIIFVRRDLAQYSIKVNFEQFSQQYQSVELRWTKNEALRLALWLVIQAWPDFYKEGGTNRICLS